MTNLETQKRESGLPGLLGLLVAMTAFLVGGLSLVEFHPGTRLYFQGETLDPSDAGGQSREFMNQKEWTSPPLWGTYAPEEGGTVVSFRADGKESQGQSISTSVLFDFDGDGETDRREVYEGRTLDLKSGFQRITPPILHGTEEFRDFTGGTVTLLLESRDGKDEPLLVSSKGSRLDVPYSELLESDPSGK